MEVRNMVEEVLGKLLAHYYYESDRKFDWYTWGSIALAGTVLILVLLIPIAYFGFKLLNIDFEVQSELRVASIITSVIVFGLVRLVLYAVRKSLIAQCRIELERTSEKQLKTYVIRFGFGVAIVAVLLSILTGAISRMVMMG